MPRSRPPYAPEFRRQMVELVRAGRSPEEFVPTGKDLRDSAPAIGRGTVIEFLMGIVPGISHAVSTFVSYAVEKKLSKEPEAFGTGKIEGVAGPETANNATTGSAMIPLREGRPRASSYQGDAGRYPIRSHHHGEQHPWTNNATKPG